MLLHAVSMPAQAAAAIARASASAAADADADGVAGSSPAQPEAAASTAEASVSRANGFEEMSLQVIRYSGVRTSYSCNSICYKVVIKITF